METEKTTTAVKISYKHWGWVRTKPLIIIEDPKVIAAALKVAPENLDKAIYRAQRNIKVSIVPILDGAEVDPALEEFETMGGHLGNIIWPNDVNLSLIVHEEPIEIKIDPNEPIQKTVARVMDSFPRNDIGVCMSEIDQECVEKLKPGDRAIFIARFWKNEFMHLGVLRVK